MTFTSTNCPGLGNEAAMVADSSYVVPAGGGTIRRFAFRLDMLDQGAELDFLVLRPTGNDAYSVVGDSGSVTLGAGSPVKTFPASIAVRAGDIIGYFEDRVDVCVAAGSGSVVSQQSSGPPGVGSTVTLGSRQAGSDLSESAVLVSHSAGG
jgi:hypothetical protein